MDKQFAYTHRKLNPTTVWLLFLLLGWSYGSMGSLIKQIFYYLTLGGFGLWTLYRLFTLQSAIRKYNRKIASDLNFSNDEMKLMGLI
tara:strand:+ start:60 stop:320 length:261 start_codon:yes stop_codon:yes gene_type:complete